MLSLSGEWWQRVKVYYSSIMPLAHGVKIAMHPSYAPLPDAPLNVLGLHRLVDIHPSRYSRPIYCIGKRYEEGRTKLVLDEFNYCGRKGKIFLVHFRNVGGILAAAIAFEEVWIMEHERVPSASRTGQGRLQKSNPDQVPHWEGDFPDRPVSTQ
ncbi:MAG: hypothetical protein QXF26_01085 [Candidatus Bathyarchaeia archaeon]